MEQNQPYTMPMDVAPINPDRDFARQMSDGGYAAGIAGSQGRSIARDPYESGGIVDNPMRSRQRAEDPLGLRNVAAYSVNSRNKTRMASMEIAPPAEVLKAGGING
jgi:hypothetical protein